MLNYRKSILRLKLCIFVGVFPAFAVFALETNPLQDGNYGNLKLATFDVDANPPVGSRLAGVVRYSLNHSQPVTHIGLGEEPVYNVVSNRWILGSDGQVRATRYTSCKDSILRSEPEGLIDPIVSLISFGNGEKPIAVLSYYAVHPQSYYCTGNLQLSGGQQDSVN